MLVCTASHCAQKGASDVVGRLRLEIVRRGLDVRILVNTCGTIDLCDIGPNVVIYPDNIIYRGVTVKDLPEIIDNLTGGPTIDRLVLDRDAPDEVTRRAFYAAAVEPDPARPTGEFVALAALHGFDEPWIAEQQRRGFVARKPAANGESIHVTKKARGRYSV